MLSHNGLVKVLWVEAYAKGTIRFMGVCKGWYPFGGLRDRGYNTFGDYVIEGALYLLSVLYRFLPLGMLDKGTEGSVLMVYVGGTLPIVSKELAKAHSRAMMSWTTTVGGVGSQPDWVWGFKGWFGMFAARNGRWAVFGGFEGRFVSVTARGRIFIVLCHRWGTWTRLSSQSSSCHWEEVAVWQGD